MIKDQLKVISISTGICFEQLFKESFDQLFDSLYSYAFSLVRNDNEANDIVQTVFTNWWEAQTHLTDAKAVKAYLFTAVYRRSLNIIRHEKVKFNNKQEYLTEVAMSSNAFSDSYGFVELEREIQEAICSLPPQCQLIFRKSRLEEKRYAEIAEEMDLSIKTVEAQMGKALRLLKEKLSDFYPLRNDKIKFRGDERRRSNG